MRQRAFIVGAGVALVLSLATIAVVLARVEQRLTRLEAGAIGMIPIAPEVAGRNAPLAAAAASGVPQNRIGGADFRVGYETFRDFYWPQFGKVADRDCWLPAASDGGRTPEAVHFYVSVDAVGAVTRTDADLAPLEGFPLPPGLVECIAGVIKTMHFPPSSPHTGRVQVDRHTRR